MPQAHGAVGFIGVPTGFSGSERAWHWNGRLLPILFSMVLWGKWWSGKRVECHCDNMAVVAVVNTGHAKGRFMMLMLRCMFFVAAYHDIHIHATHLPGVENTAVDALSPNNLLIFLQVVPDASECQCPSSKL